jgi:hypothetical protein
VQVCLLAAAGERDGDVRAHERVVFDECDVGSERHPTGQLLYTLEKERRHLVARDPLAHHLRRSVVHAPEAERREAQLRLFTAPQPKSAVPPIKFRNNAQIRGFNQHVVLIGPN